jgi:DNA-binding NarL/FixJ family response regulator
MSTVRVLLVEDFEPFRRFVCSTLAQRPDLQVIGEVSDGVEAVQKAEELKPDLILLDIGLPSMNGIEVARQMSKLVPESKVIFLTQENDSDVVRAALSNGAKGYVLKSDAESELVQAIEAVLRGGYFRSSGTKGARS